MSRYLIDSPVLIGVLEGRKARVELLRRLLEQDHGLAVSPVSAAEVFAAYRTGSRAKTASLIRSLEILPISVEVAQRAGKLIEHAAKKGPRLTVDSALLAASAEVYDCVLLTDRPRQFPTGTNVVTDVKARS